MMNSLNGSIVVAIHAYASDEPVSGGTLELYQIADAYGSDTEGYGYVYTSDFAGCDNALLTEDGLGLADTADVFAAWIQKEDIPALVSLTVNADGEAYFADLSCGLYMITQGTAAEGYHAVNPFLVTVPALENGTWSFRVDATPKTSPITKAEGPTTHENPSTVDHPATKTLPITGGGTNPSTRVKTGDSTNVVGLVLIAAVAAVVIIIAARRRWKM